MRGVTFNQQTSTAALLFFTIYVIYGLFYIPFVQYLVSLAVGGIAYGITDSYEVATLALFAMNFLFPLIVPAHVVVVQQGAGAPASATTKEGFMAVDPKEISERVEKMKEKGFVSGVGSAMSEGFEDARQPDLTLSENRKAETTNTVPVAVPATGSVPAPTASAPAAPTAPVAGMPTAPAAGPTKPKAISEQGVPPAQQPATAGFQDSGNLFKLGQIPSDSAGGFHIDTGTTVMNALKALNPEQIQAMTADTRQLIETQKSLMSMLNSFTPMLQEGRQLMNTFGTMFGPTMGANVNAPATQVTG
jgi:hypothetical protein